MVDGTGARCLTHATLFSGHCRLPEQARQPAACLPASAPGPTPGIEFPASRHFLTSSRGTVGPNVIGFQGILRYKIDDKDASFAGTELEPILSSRDPNFRPSDIEVGPDGAIYFLDWQNPIIGHMQHNLRASPAETESTAEFTE